MSQPPSNPPQHGHDPAHRPAGQHAPGGSDQAQSGSHPVETGSGKSGWLKWLLAAIAALIVLGLVLAFVLGGDDEDADSDDDTTNAAQASAEMSEDNTPGDNSDSDPGEPAPATGDQLVRFEAETSDGALIDVSYYDRFGTPTHVGEMTPPWSEEIRTAALGDDKDLYMVAQNKGPGEVTCRIFIEGELVSEMSAPGMFNIATCVEPPKIG